MPGTQSLGCLNGGLITAWSNDLKVHKVPDDSNSPSSESGSSTAVYDGGDSRQLQQRRRRRASYPAVIDKESLIKDVGSNFLSTSLTQNDRSGSKRTTLPDQSLSCGDTALELGTEKGSSLENKILDALELSSGRYGRRFLPFDQIDKIFTYEAVLQELQTHYQDRTPKDLQGLAHEIYDDIILPDSSLTTRRKIFGILVRINKAAWITHFIDEDLYDSDLPFSFPSSYEQYKPVTRRTDGGNRVPMNCFTVPRWTHFERELFEQYQWEFQAPFFEVTPTNGQQKRPIHYVLANNSILPFTEDFEGEGIGATCSGGYSEVWRVRIHPAHHSHPSSENPYFAVKRLRPTNRTLEMFKQEVATLKRLSERNHAHLMRLELTYEHQERFHLLFRWADGNLRDYWERHPEPSHIPRTHAFAVWVSQQCLGLAEALMMIHECPPDSGLTANDETDGLALQRTNGRHGDIKPENILWFQPHECNGDQSTYRGLVSPMNIAMSPTYSAPEYEVSETISQSFDIWSLGCVLMEFFVWYLKGFQDFDKFSRDRAAEDNTAPIKMDNYFKVVGKARKNDGRVSKEAVLKKAVASQFESLHQHPKISELLVDALDFIEEKMLRMGPEKRATSEEVAKRFREIYEKASTDAQYCLEPVPGRPKRVNTDLSTLAPHVFNTTESEVLNPKSSQHAIEGDQYKSLQVSGATEERPFTEENGIQSMSAIEKTKSWPRTLEVPRSRDSRENRQLDHSPSTNRSSSRSTYQTNPKLPLPMDNQDEHNGKRHGIRQKLRSLFCW